MKFRWLSQLVVEGAEKHAENGERGAFLQKKYLYEAIEKGYKKDPWHPDIF